MSTEKHCTFCDSCGDQILKEDVLRLFGNDYCDVCYHDQDDEVPSNYDADWYSEGDFEPSYDLDCGYDPYLGAYSDDC